VSERRFVVAVASMAEKRRNEGDVEERRNHVAKDNSFALPNGDP
jgi:hypothetical protein